MANSCRHLPFIFYKETYILICGVVHLSILKLIFLEVLHHNYSFKIQQAVIGTQVNCSVECPNMFLFPNQPDISDT